jgi:hypothetical protein
MNNTIITEIGKILSAVVAITIAGCLIHKEQKRNTSILLTEIVATEKKEGTAVEKETSEISVAESIAYAPVQELSITVHRTSYNLSTLKKEEFNTFIKTLNTDVISTMNYFHTSKSYVPRIDDNNYYLYLEKENHKHIVNYGFLSEETWNKVFLDIKKFYRKTKNIDYRCDETKDILYSKDMNEPISLLNLKDNKQIHDILSEVDKERMAQLFSFSSSKSLAPPIDKHSYFFTFIRKGRKINYSALLLETKTWEQVRTEIIDCSISVSMDYLYTVQP